MCVCRARSHPQRRRARSASSAEMLAISRCHCDSSATRTAASAARIVPISVGWIRDRGIQTVSRAESAGRAGAHRPTTPWCLRTAPHVRRIDATPNDDHQLPRFARHAALQPHPPRTTADIPSDRANAAARRGPRLSGTGRSFVPDSTVYDAAWQRIFRPARAPRSRSYGYGGGDETHCRISTMWI